MPLSDPASSTTLRLTLLTVLVAGFFVALFSRLWFLQVLAGERYAELAERNRVRFVVTEAPRGRILARDGRELVKNRPALTVSGDRNRLLDADGRPRSPEAVAVLDRLSGLLGLPVDEIVERLTSRRLSPFRAVPIVEDVAPEIVFAIREHQELYPGIVAETLPVRTYPQGMLAAHLVGYIGEITEEQLGFEEYEGYRPGDLVGKAGLERTYEAYLQGREGLRKLEVNAEGTILDTLGVRDPEPGADLYTTLDLELQRELETLLYDGLVQSRTIQRDDGRYVRSTAGSAVVLDPRNGEVLAMASWPSYDPSVFVGGVSPTDWAWLNDEANHYPLLNRAIYSAYPPGSTFKPITAASGLETGMIGTGTTLPCPPSWQLGNHTFRNWSSRNEGAMDVSLALKRSCDTFFYEVAHRQWRREVNADNAGQPVDEAIQRMAGAFGLGRELGIDLPGESAGIVPDRAWRQATWERLRPTYCAAAESAPDPYARRLNEDLCQRGHLWRGGDSVNMSIGQGDVLTTPLQIAAAYMAIANGGTLWRPHVGGRVEAPDGEELLTVQPEALGQLPLTPEQLREIQHGLERVVMEERGTANYAFAGFPLDHHPLAGKTGTAEFGSRIPYAWFVAYGPTPDPRYVVVVSVEEGGGGSQTAAPIARRILEAAFDLPVTPFQAGIPTD